MLFNKKPQKEIKCGYTYPFSAVPSAQEMNPAL